MTEPKKVPIVLNKVGPRVDQVRLDGATEVEGALPGTGKYLIGGIGYEPEQVPVYFRQMTAADRTRLADYNRRMRKLREERQQHLNAAWERGRPLTEAQVQNAVHKKTKEAS